MLGTSISVSSQESWSQEKTIDNIRAYSRMKSGKDYYEYRTVFTVKSSFRGAVDLVFDIANFKNWLPNCVESKVIHKVSGTVLLGYTVTEAPWPASDRDAAFIVTKRKEKENCYSITMEGKANDYPLQKGKVRVHDYHAVWKITELAPDNLEIEYIASFNPGKGAPNWMIKNSVIEARIKSSQNLIKELKKREDS